MKKKINSNQPVANDTYQQVDLNLFIPTITANLPRNTPFSRTDLYEELSKFI